MTTVDRFLEKFIKYPNNQCWIWHGAKNKAGYGLFRINGKQKLAHRFSYEYYIGDFDRELCVCHHCDNPSCVKPSHLFVGTHKDNSDDMIAKGRDYHPVENTAKLDQTAVLEIRKSGEADRSIAPKYGISRSLVGAIRRREIWKHLNG